jgi:hypothetical protein
MMGKEEERIEKTEVRMERRMLEAGQPRKQPRGQTAEDILAIYLSAMANSHDLDRPALFDHFINASVVADPDSPVIF